MTPLSSTQPIAPNDVPRDVHHLGDFRATPRMVVIAALAIPVGAIAAVVAWALLRLIGLITNAIFYQRIDTALVAPVAVTTTGMSCCSPRSSVVWSSG